MKFLPLFFWPLSKIILWNKKNHKLKELLLCLVASKSLLSIKGHIDVEKALNNLTMAEIKSITLHPEELFTRCGHLLALPYRVADFFILCYWSLNLSKFDQSLMVFLASRDLATSKPDTALYFGVAK